MAAHEIILYLVSIFSDQIKNESSIIQLILSSFYFNKIYFWHHLVLDTLQCTLIRRMGGLVN